MWPHVILPYPKLDREPDLYETLGLSLGTPQDEVDLAYRNLLKKEKKYNIVSYLAWKVLRDPLYAPLYEKTKSLQYVYEAGFFVDSIFPEDVHLLRFLPGSFTTPLHKIASNLKLLKKGEKAAILVTTGAFSPIHFGHLGMMEVAKEELEKEHYRVVGGYFSPSHDAYVSTKYKGEAAFDSAHRIHLCERAVGESDWLMVDPWEARFIHTAVNFTDVLLRLQGYINHYFPKQSVEIFYVFGSDNVKFVRVFKERMGAVCVARNKDSFSEIQQDEGIKGNSRIHFVENTRDHAFFTSSEARKWKANLMPNEVSDVYFKWRKNILNVESGSARQKRYYVVRDDGEWALDPWFKKLNRKKLLQAKERFTKHLTKALKDVFLKASMPDISIDMDIKLYDLEEQVTYVDSIEKNENVVNLDICTNGNSGLNVSRLFYLANGQLRSRGLVARPGFSDPSSQIASLEPGEYTLLDDDLGSGSTMNMLLGMLPEQVRVIKIRTLLEYSKRMERERRGDMSYDQEVFDVVDLRDFLIGSKASGLVVRLPNEDIARAPYVVPYVSLISRASIPSSSEMKLSVNIWKINLEFFESLEDDPIRISDLDEYVQKLFLYLGFKKDMSVVDLCRWHLDNLFFDQ